MADLTTAMRPANGWLQECLAGHESCKKRARLSTIWSSDNMHIIRDLGVRDMMPRRLLRLDAQPTVRAVDEPDKIHLVEFAEATKEEPYIALSYCWGSGSNMPNALLKNLEALKTDGLAVKDLPRTFRDAIAVTRNLGREYLWIDALCIVQDDSEDWMHEAPRMAIIYGNAECTIHAVDSADSDKGLFPAQPPESEIGVLESRGWTMQERAISPRSLLFSAGEMRWECREGEATFAVNSAERDISQSPLAPRSTDVAQHRGLKDLFVFFRDWRIPGSAPDDEPSQEPRMALSYGLQANPGAYSDFLVAWWDLIALYTPRRLTQESDRFLAMNGVAAVAQRWVQLRNSWGLWLDFLHQDLLWYIDPAGPPGQPTTRWLAPSWSWASKKQGRIRNGFHERMVSLGKGGTLMIKPEIGIPYGTSFDQSLPIPAWQSRESQTIMLKGDLRCADITAYRDTDGSIRYRVEDEPTGSWAGGVALHDFRPDVPDDFPLGACIKVFLMLLIHYDASEMGPEDHTNVLLVLKQRNGRRHLSAAADDLREEEFLEERSMSRLGYLETRFGTQRDKAAVQEELWWRQVYLS